MKKEGLDRFLVAQMQDYAIALAEVKGSRKKSHWMWYIFPQISGLGYSDMSRHFGLDGLAEAGAFLKDPVLGKRLIRISTELLGLPSTNARDIFGSPDDMKLRSCMTLFSMVPDTDPVFEEVLQKFFGGIKDEKTTELLRLHIGNGG